MRSVRMGKFIVLYLLAIVSTVRADAIPTEQLTAEASTIFKEDRYIKLLSRVENLEDRDREQQAEIHSLRSELNTERQRTSKFEAKLSWLMLNIDEHVNDDVNATAVTDRSFEQQTYSINAKKTVHATISTRVSGEQNSRIRRQVTVPVIAFHATLTNLQQHNEVHQIIAFDNVITNIGAAYNPHAGVFTGPVAGVYVFSTTILGSHNQELSCSIVKNGVSVANLYMKDTVGAYDADSAMVVLHLSKGDDVEIQGDGPDKFIHGGHYSMFSGFLLHENQPTEGIVGK